MLGDADMHALERTDPVRIMRNAKAMKPLLDWRTEKENEGRFTWSLGLYGTAAMAAEAALSEQEYWQQIIDACFLDETDPIARWKSVSGQIEDYMQRLNELPIEGLDVQGEDVGPAHHARRAAALDRRQRPQHPELRDLHEPRLARDGGLDPLQPAALSLRQSDRGHVPRVRAAGTWSSRGGTRNEAVLTEMIATENADKVGEYSLTDSRFSRITKFMAETLYDENVGGPFGNTHLALGSSYHDCYDGDPARLTPERWDGARLQRLDRPHRHRLDDRPHRHRDACATAASG